MNRNLAARIEKLERLSLGVVMFACADADDVERQHERYTAEYPGDTRTALLIVTGICSE